MENQKTIFVTGVTGNQGGAITRNLVANGFRVKALVRDPSSPKVEALRKLNVEIIKGDLNDPDTYSSGLAGVDGVFALMNFVSGTEKELIQGIQLVDRAREKGIGHFLYSSVGACDRQTGIPHFESKFKIENHVKKSGLPYTIIRPSSFYENFLFPQVKSRILKGKLVVPLDKNVVQQFLSTEDIGKSGTHIFMNPEKFLFKTISLASEQMDQVQVARTFSDVLGKEIKFARLPGLITRLAMGKDLHTMFKWVNKNSGIFDKDYENTKKELPPMLSLREWIKLHFHS